MFFFHLHTYIDINRPESGPEIPEIPEILKCVLKVLKFHCCPEIFTYVLIFFLERQVPQEFASQGQGIPT